VSKLTRKQLTSCGLNYNQPAADLKAHAQAAYILWTELQPAGHRPIVLLKVQHQRLAVASDCLIAVRKHQ
jgi:hypothetical protein